MSATLCLPTRPVHRLPMADLSPADLSIALEQLLLQGTGTAVFTPNALIGAACDRDPALRSLVSSADLLLPDGAGVVLASRRERSFPPLRYRLPGIEAGEAVLRLCTRHRLPVYFFGGRPGVAQAAADRWQAELPALPPITTHHGYFTTREENEDICAHIRGSGAAAVFVCLGFPRQERWILDNRPRLPSVRMLLGLGGSLDVWAGALRRAPAPLRALRCEWLWRMLCQPRRFADLPAMVGYVWGKKPREPGI